MRSCSWCPGCDPGIRAGISGVGSSGPLLEIIDVTQQLRDGRLYNRTNVKRSDELGDLAKQVNSVADKFTEVISQVRDSTGFGIDRQ